MLFLMLETSEIRPTIAGKNAPPIIASTSSDEPRLVGGRRFLILKHRMISLRVVPKPTGFDGD